MTYNITDYFGYNIMELYNSECIEDRGDMDIDKISYYSQLHSNDYKHNPLYVDEETTTVIKYGKCKKCGFGDVGVAKFMDRYEYDIINVKYFMNTTIDWQEAFKE